MLTVASFSSASFSRSSFYSSDSWKPADFSNTSCLMVWPYMLKADR